jgi:hypothetical protein
MSSELTSDEESELEESSPAALKSIMISSLFLWPTSDHLKSYGFPAKAGDVDHSCDMKVILILYSCSRVLFALADNLLTRCALPSPLWTNPQLVSPQL